MPENKEAMQEQQIHAAPIHVEEQKEETIRAHLSTLQTWDVAEGQTLEERRAEHAQRIIQEERVNYELLVAAQQQLQPANANAAAPGQPQQLQAPAKQTFKEKQADKKKVKEARRYSSTGNLDTYEMVHTLKDLRAERLNSMTTKRFEDAAKAGVDSRVLTVFCDGYRTDEDGDPATLQDLLKKRSDNAFLDDYLSNDVKRREPYLKDITHSILKMRLNPEVLNQSYVKKNLRQLKNVGDQLCYFENIYKDPVNKPFFDGLTELEHRLINIQLESGPRLTGTLTNLLAIKGVGLSSNDYVDGDTFIEINAEQAPIYQDYFREGLQAQRDGVEAAISQVLEERIAPFRAAHLETSNAMKLEAEETAKKYSDMDLTEMFEKAENMRMEANLAASLNKISKEEHAEQLEAAEKVKKEAERITSVKGLSGLNLTGYVHSYNFDAVADTRKYIEGNPQAYQKHKELMDRIYHEMYRAVDALGDNILETNSLQEICSNWPFDTQVEKMVLSRIARRQEALVTDATLMRTHLDKMQNVVRHLMLGKSLDEPSRDLLEKWGTTGAAAPAEGPNPEE